MPNFGIDPLEDTLRSVYSHIMNAGSFNEGQPNQVSGNDLPEAVKARVDQLASVRDSLANLDGPEVIKQRQHIQDAINFLYNPRTREAAMASWAQMHGDEHNRWSATGGHLGTAAGIANSMTTDPDHNLYGGRRK